MKHLSTIAITFLLLFTSCNRNGGEKSVFDHIPAESTAVARVDFAAILKNAGCKIRDGKVTLSPSMEFLLDEATPRQHEFLTSLAELYPLLDMEHIMIADYDHHPVGYTTVKDMELMEQYLDSKGVASEKDGYTIYVTSTLSIYIEDDIAILAESPEEIAKQNNLALITPLSANQAVTEFFKEADATISSVSGNLGVTPAATQFCNIYLHDHSIEATIELMADDGLPLDLEQYLTPVNDTVVHSIPSKAQATIVMGKPVGEKNIAELIPEETVDMLPFGGQWMFLAEFINDSFAVSATPAATATYLRSLSPSAWNYTASIANNGNRYSDVVSVLAPGLKLFFEQEGTLLTVSNNEILPDAGESEFAGKFSGVLFGLGVNVPYKSETMRSFNLPYGPNLLVTAESDKVTLRFSLNGATCSILEGIAETAQALK